MTAVGAVCARDRHSANDVARAYGVPVVRGGSSTTESVRSRVVRGRPNWWVILAVSLALMALLVATSGGTPHRGRRGQALGGATSSDAHAGATRHAGGSPASAAATTTTTPPTSPTAPSHAVAAQGGGSTPANAGETSLTAASRSPAGSGSPTAGGGAPPTTTTTAPAPATTTTTSPGVVEPADRTQTEGYLDPPVQTSSNFDFAGSGAMQVAVVWSGNTYLTLSVSCPTGGQDVGGTAAMQATLPDASGECQATVAEPSAESTPVTFTLTIGPAGG